MRSRAQPEAGGQRRRIAGVNLDITQQKLLAENTLRRGFAPPDDAL